MNAVLERPAEYLDLLEEEFDDIDGGIAPAAVVGIITGAMAIGGGLYGIGQVAGERAYRAGLRNSYYQQIKWQVRGSVLGIVGIVPGGIIMTGFENKFYSM